MWPTLHTNVQSSIYLKTIRRKLIGLWEVSSKNTWLISTSDTFIEVFLVTPCPCCMENQLTARREQKRTVSRVSWAWMSKRKRYASIRCGELGLIFVGWPKAKSFCHSIRTHCLFYFDSVVYAIYGCSFKSAQPS